MQVGVPVELSFEVSDSFGITATGGPVYTQAGEARFDVRSVGGSLGVLFDVVL